MASRLPLPILNVGVCVVVLSACGCASSGYLRDRGRDAADIFTCAVGTGAGVKARVGPVQVAVFENSDAAGLRCGESFLGEDALAVSRETYGVIPMGYGVRDWTLDFGSEEFLLAPGRVANQRAKTVRARSPWPFIVVGNSAAFYTQIEVAVGVVGTLRLGLNPGEIVDFILGWAGLDLFGDDLGAPAL